MTNEELQRFAEALKGDSQNFEIYFESDDILVLKQEVIEGITIFFKIKWSDSDIKVFYEIRGILNTTDAQELKTQMEDIIACMTE